MANQEPVGEVDMSLVPVRLLYQGEEGHYNETVNGRTYSFSLAPMYQAVLARQEDVEELMSRAKFKVLSEWYKPATKAGGVISNKILPVVADSHGPEIAYPLKERAKDAGK